MRNNYRAIRIEIPEELYERFKEHTKNDYKTQTGVVREMILGYIKDKEKENGK